MDDELYLDFLEKLKDNKIDLIHDDSGKYVSYEEASKEFEAKGAEFDIDKFSSQAEAVETPEYVYGRIVKGSKVVDELNLTGDDLEKDLSKEGEFKAYEDLRITGDNVTITNADIKGTLTLDPGKDGSVLVKDTKADAVKVLSGAEKSIHLQAVEAGVLEVNSDDNKTRVECKEVKIDKTIIRTYTVVDKVSGKMGKITVKFQEGTKKQVVEFDGEFTEEVIVESSAELKTAKNAKVPKVVVQPKDKESEIKFNGVFEEVEVSKEAKINLSDKAKISKSLKVTANAEVNISEKAKVIKVEVAPNNKKSVIKINGPVVKLEVTKEAGVELGSKTKINYFVAKADVEISGDEKAEVKSVRTEGNAKVDTGKGSETKLPPVNKTEDTGKPSGGGGGSHSGGSSGGGSTTKPTVSISGVKDQEVTEEETIAAGITATSGASLTYTSSDASIATVDSNGNIKGVSEGEVTITVKASKSGYYGKTETFKVYVKSKVDELIGTLALVADGVDIIHENSEIGEYDYKNNKLQITIKEESKTNTAQDLFGEKGKFKGLLYLIPYIKDDIKIDDSSLRNYAIKIFEDSKLYDYADALRNGNLDNGYKEFFNLIKDKSYDELKDIAKSLKLGSRDLDIKVCEKSLEKIKASALNNTMTIYDIDNNDKNIKGTELRKLYNTDSLSTKVKLGDLKGTYTVTIDSKDYTLEIN
jgi:N-acetylmuramoyl-L-alanine amidase